MPIPQKNDGDVLFGADWDTWAIPQAAMKTLDQSVTSSVVMVNDTVLVLPIVASAQYDFSCYLNYEGLAGACLSWQWTVPAAATLRYKSERFDSAFATGGITNVQLYISALANTLNAGTVVTAIGNGAGQLQSATMTGTLITGANAGNLQLQWTQGTSSGTPTIVHGQSKLRLDRVG